MFGMRRREFITLLGGAMAAWPLANFPLLYERAAVYVDKIRKGANPATLPVEQPSKFQVTVNIKAAQALGLSLSPVLLAQIDEVID
jgi:putative ABC transport system substrate-binding protein